MGIVWSREQEICGIFLVTGKQEQLDKILMNENALTRRHTDHFSNIFPPVTVNSDLWPDLWNWPR